jgi:hypothetical protein
VIYLDKFSKKNCDPIKNYLSMKIIYF